MSKMTYKEAKQIIVDVLCGHDHSQEEILDALVLSGKALDTMQEMYDRSVTPEMIMNYMMFEDECVKKGFDFKSLLEAREKMTAMKPYYLQYGTNPKIGNWHCNVGHIILNKCDYCPDCGQKLDWSEVENGRN